MTTEADEWKAPNADELYAAQRMQAIGAAAAAIKDWRLAAKMFDELSKLLPNKDSFSALGEALGQMGKLDQARIAFDRALAIDPNHFSAWFNMGVMYELAGDSEEAAKAYEAGLKISDNASARNNLANCQRALLKLDEAEANYRRAVELGYTGAQMNLSLLLMLKGEYVKGIPMFELRDKYGSDQAYGPAREMLRMLNDARA